MESRGAKFAKATPRERQGSEERWLTAEERFNEGIQRKPGLRLRLRLREKRPGEEQPGRSGHLRRRMAVGKSRCWWLLHSQFLGGLQPRRTREAGKGGRQAGKGGRQGRQAREKERGETLFK